MSSNLFSSRILIITKAVVKKEPRARRFSSGWTERNSECSNILRLKSEFEIYEFRFARKLNSGQSYLLFLLHVTAHLLRFDRCNLSVITETENTNNRAQVPGVVRRRFFPLFLIINRTNVALGKAQRFLGGGHSDKLNVFTQCGRSGLVLYLLQQRQLAASGPCIQLLSEASVTPQELQP